MKILRAKGAGIEIPKEDWILDGYKEPIRKVKNGYGYYGVVIRSKDRERVMSMKDGKFYTAINNAHVNKFGFKNVDEYKKTFGIATTTPLCGISRSRLMQEKGIKYFERVGASKLKLNRELGIKANKNRAGTRMPLEIRNKRGTCPDQLLDKISSLQKKLKAVPSTGDFRQEYGTHYLGLLSYYFGSWVNAVKLAGFIPKSISYPQGFTTEELLERVRIFFENHGYTPLSRHFGTDVLPCARVYRKHWKTLNAVRLNAGVPLVMSLKKGIDKYSIDASPEVF